MPYRSLDSRISSAIALAVRRSHPQFDHHLRGLGVARYIQEVSRQELESLFLAGEIALTSCLTKYLCQRSTAAMAYCGTIRTRVLSPQTYELLIAQAGCSTVDSSIADLCLPFVGALLSKFGFRCIFEWFVAAFGPLVDDATDACDEYNIDSALRTHNSKKRAHSRGEEPGAKRAKHTLSERKSFQFAEVKAMIKDLTSGTDPSLKVPSNEMLLTVGRISLSCNQLILGAGDAERPLVHRRYFR
ncbi:hypothetical protein FB451DRAFT_135029 [Mycena latifolia]|nr:hypothetical protein FB451DRAFT_135029 [Mycena latifolia]